MKNDDPTPVNPNQTPASTPAPRPKGKIFDISRPGKTAASPTSRPVILGHKAEAVRTQISISGIGEHEKLMDPRQKIGLAPVSTPQPSKVEPPKAESTPVPEAAEPTPLPVTDLASVAEALGPVPTPPTPESTPSPDEKSKDKKKDDDLLPEEKPVEVPMNEASLTELATETPADADPLPPEPSTPAAATPQAQQTVAAPLTQEEIDNATAEAAAMGMPQDEAKGPVVADHAQHHVFRTVLLVLLLVILAVFVLDVLLDSGVLTITALPHTHFFN